MLNNCFRCHREPYETSADHWHYCNDCVKVCAICKELKVLWAFNFDFKSEEFKRWKATDCHGFMNVDGHTAECGSCLARITDLLQPKKIVIDKAGFVMTPAMLQLMKDAMRAN
jgi:hypothetical protein